jgi:GNAT superfamily N-acetyltransferase
MPDTETAAAEVPPIVWAGLLETIEREAWVDLCAAAPAEFAAHQGLSVMRIGGVAVLLLGAMDHVQFNRVIGLGVDEPTGEAALDAALARYRSAGVSNFLIHVAPMAQPALRGWLAARGLVPYRRAWAKFWRDDALPPLIATDLKVHEIDAAQAADFSAVICGGFGMPPLLRPWLEALAGRPGWRLYLACEGATPVAGGALYCRDGTAWLGIAATLPQHRGRGAQGALMARRIADAAAAGCSHIATETGEAVPGEPNPSHSNMLRLGFRPVYSRLNYALPAKG